MRSPTSNSITVLEAEVESLERALERDRKRGSYLGMGEEKDSTPRTELSSEGAKGPAPLRESAFERASPARLGALRRFLRVRRRFLGGVARTHHAGVAGSSPATAIM